MDPVFGVKTQAGKVYGPYTYDEATRVAKRVEQPNEVIGLGDSAYTQGLFQFNWPWWLPLRIRQLVVTAFLLLAMSFFFALGPSTVITLSVSPHAYERVDADLVSNTATQDTSGSDRDFQARLKNASHNEDWTIAVIGLFLYLMAAYCALVHYYWVDREWLKPMKIFWALWGALLIYSLATAPFGSLPVSGMPFSFH